MEAPPDLVAFCREQQGRLVGILTLYCGDKDVAEELAQEALVRACNNWRSLRRMPLPEAWVHRVAINLANSHFRRKLAERRARARAASRALLVHRDPDPDTSVAVRRAVAGLPKRQRMALLLRYFADLPVAEVAHAMGCPEGTVKTLTHRAIASLREGLVAPEREEATNVV